MTELNDQRRSPRCEVDLFVEEFADGHSFLHPAVDLSLHGIYILMKDSRRAVDGLRDVHIQYEIDCYVALQLVFWRSRRATVRFQQR